MEKSLFIEMKTINGYNIFVDLPIWSIVIGSLTTAINVSLSIKFCCLYNGNKPVERKQNRKKKNNKNIVDFSVS